MCITQHLKHTLYALMFMATRKYQITLASNAMILSKTKQYNICISVELKILIFQRIQKLKKIHSCLPYS